jgi:hypothetical protein
MIVEVLNPAAEKRRHCVKALDIYITRQCFGYEEALRLAGEINTEAQSDFGGMFTRLN